MPQTQPALVRLPKGADLLAALKEACHARGFDEATGLFLWQVQAG